MVYTTYDLYYTFYILHTMYTTDDIYYTWYIQHTIYTIHDIPYTPYTKQSFCPLIIILILQFLKTFWALEFPNIPLSINKCVIRLEVK